MTDTFAPIRCDDHYIDEPNTTFTCVLGRGHTGLHRGLNPNSLFETRDWPHNHCGVPSSDGQLLCEVTAGHGNYHAAVSAPGEKYAWYAAPEAPAPAKEDASTRERHLANGPLVASIRNFVAVHDRAADGEELDAIIAVADGGTLTLHALRTLLAEHDAYRSEARGWTDAEPQSAPVTCQAKSWPFGKYVCDRAAGHDGDHGAGTAVRYQWPQYAAVEPHAGADAARTAQAAVRIELTPGSIAPAWAYDLLIAVLNYEDVHGPHADGWTCFGVLVDSMVPPDQIEKARVIDTYWSQKEPT